ncbi:hypothetical protein HNP72_003681 [Sphingobacterium soli]|nr:hypothetical protein [Sphingobacterium soli]
MASGSFHYTGCHGEHWSLLATGLRGSGRLFSHPTGQCPAYQKCSGTEDRQEG